MKVYFINSVFKHGSTGNICAGIGETLKSNGAEYRIAYGRRGEKNTVNDGYLIVDKKQLFMHVIFTRLTDRHGLASKKATKNLIKDIMDFCPDIIHLHNLHGYYLNYEILFDFLYAYKKPIIWTLHDCWAFTGHCAYFSVVQCEKWKCLCEKCELRNEYPQSWYRDQAKQNYCKKRKSFTRVENMVLVTPSYWLKSIVKESFLKDYPVEVIYNGIDLEKFYPRDREIFRSKVNAKDKKIILGVANVWSSSKGLQRIAELQDYLDENYLIVVVGISERQKKELPKEICCIHRTESMDELAEIYSAADVFFNASVQETMGMTTIEALACGTPVVVYNRTAIPEVVPDDGGIVVEPGDIRRVKAAIDQLIEAPSKDYFQMVHKYEKKKQYEKYVLLYRRSLE